MTMKETQQQIQLRKEAISFAEWVSSHSYVFKYQTWWKGGDTYTTEQLYSFFKQQPNQ